jgi:transposase
VKNQVLQQNINRNGIEMQVVMPLDLGMRIEAEESVRTLVEVTERMDYRKLTQTYQRQPRRGEATAKQMFQIVILGFMLGQNSTRKIESSCRNDIRFMYLLSGVRAPEHSRIARFIKKHLQGEIAEELFYQLVLLLEEKGEIEFSHLFADGTKIEANANRYSFVWAKSTHKYDARVDEKLTLLMDRLAREYAIITEEAADCLSMMHEIKESRGIHFVYGRGKRKSQLQRDIEELEALLARKKKYASYKKIFKN